LSECEINTIADYVLTLVSRAIEQTYIEIKRKGWFTKTTVQHNAHPHLQ